MFDCLDYATHHVPSSDSLWVEFESGVIREARPSRVKTTAVIERIHERQTLGQAFNGRHRRQPGSPLDDQFSYQRGNSSLVIRQTFEYVHISVALRIDLGGTAPHWRGGFPFHGWKLAPYLNFMECFFDGIDVPNMRRYRPTAPGGPLQDWKLEDDPNTMPQSSSSMDEPRRGSRSRWRYMGRDKHQKRDLPEEVPTMLLDERQPKSTEPSAFE
jgi:hypothetical protein